MATVDDIDQTRTAIFHDVIAPILFPSQDAESAPVLTLLVDPPGSGAGRAAHSVGAPGVSLVSLDDLAVFALSSRPGDERGAGVAAGREEAAEWLRMTLAHARESRRSLIVQGAFPNARAAIGTAQGFAKAGFRAQLAVVVPSRAASLLASLSIQLAALRDGEKVSTVSTAGHDEAWSRARDLVGEAVDVEFDAIALFDPDGNRVERDRDGDEVAVVDRLRSSRMSTITATRWLSELNRLVEFTREHRSPTPATVETLIDLHQLALSEVIPQLDISRSSRARVEQERRIVARTVALRDLLPTTPSAPPRAPAPRPTTPTPDRGGISR